MNSAQGWTVRAVTAVLLFLGSGSVLAETSASEATASKATEALERQIAALEQALDAQIAATVAGTADHSRWEKLRERFLRLSPRVDESANDELRARFREDRLRFELLSAVAEDPKAFERRRAALEREALPEKLPTGTVSGRVTASLGGAPLSSTLIFFENPEFFDFAEAGLDGAYSIALPAGTYSAFATVDGFICELYDERPCGSSEGDPVAVVPEQELTGIDFTLDRRAVFRGRITDAQTDEPLIFGEVWVLEEDGGDFFFFDVVFPDSEGRYESDRLLPGNYVLIVKQPGYQGEALDDVPCSGMEPGDPGAGCSLTEARRVTATPNGVVEGLDFALEPGGSIAGRITDAATGEGLPGVIVAFAPTPVGSSETTTTDAQGRYASPGLESGTYLISTRNFLDYLDEVYPNTRCIHFPGFRDCPLAEGEALAAGPGTTLEGVDLALDLGGSITGTVTRAIDGQPLSTAARISVLGVGEGEAFSDTRGRYEIRGLNPGSYRAFTFANGFISQVYDGLDCTDGCPDADPVIVEIGQETPNIDFSLSGLGRLIVEVKGADGEPVTEGSVLLWDLETFSPAEAAFHVGSGRYEAPEARPGLYVVTVEDTTGVHFAELYPDLPCPFLRCDLSSGDTVEIRADETAEISVDLNAAGRLPVRAVGRLTGVPLEFIFAEIYDGDRNLLVSETMFAEGTLISGLAPGTYYGIAAGGGIDSHIFGGGDCAPFDVCDPLTGTPIEVAAGLNPEILFEPRVVQCGFSEREFCPRSGRFRAVARWQDASGSSDYGFFSSLTSDSGTFWFFDRENVEGVVKVLDGCPLNDRFWVFAAGLTDVEVTLWLTDLATQDTRIYTNPVGQAFRPIQDTSAFATCGADGLFSAPGSLPASRFEPAPAGRPKACAPSSGSLCLAGGRFSVEAFFRSGTGSEQQAGAEFLTDDSGYFWFFDRDNVEILVKVLDACAFNERFWVFGAGLTDVEVRLRVTDTETGQVKEYLNAQGDAFEPVQDTAAFKTCF